jgi:hypothetical protein
MIGGKGDRASTMCWRAVLGASFLIAFLSLSLPATAQDCEPLKPIKPVDTQIRDKTEANADTVLKSLLSGSIKNEYERITTNVSGEEVHKWDSFIYMVCTILRDSKMSPEEKLGRLPTLIQLKGQAPPISGQKDHSSSSSDYHNLPSLDQARASEPIHLVGGGWWDLSLYRCENDHDLIVCYFVIKKMSGNVGDYAAEKLIGMTSGKAKLVDRFRIDHRMIKAYFINGRNQGQETISLGPKESAWLALEFEGASPDITAAKIVLGNQRLDGVVR